ncbi:hypothetical protein BH11PLA1_BH11PLA1_23530 [soil metagenome]
MRTVNAGAAWRRARTIWNRETPVRAGVMRAAVLTACAGAALAAAGMGGCAGTIFEAAPAHERTDRAAIRAAERPSALSGTPAKVSAGAGALTLPKAGASTAGASGLSGATGFGTGATTATGFSGTAPSAAVIPRAVVPGIAGEPDVRVRLTSATSALKVGVTRPVGGGDGVVWVAGAGSARPAARMVAPVSVRLTSRGWVVTDAAGVSGTFDAGSELRVQASPEEGGGVAGSSPRYTGVTLASASGGNGGGRGAPGSPGARGLMPGAALMIDGRAYPGALALQPRRDAGGAAFDVIAQVGVEDYLKGVVAAEMYPSWPLGAFQAQAVAARSYALHERQRARVNGSRFDVESTTNDQAYRGGEAPPQVARAVDSTRGVILTWNGTVLRSYYSSTSGGRAAGAKDTWPVARGTEFNLAGPLQASPREETGSTSPYFRWTVSRSRGELSSRLREWGRVNAQPVKGIGTIVHVQTAERNVVGRPVRYLVTDAGDRTFTLSAEQLRQACNQSAPGVQAVVRENRVNSGDIEVQIIGDAVSIRGRGYGHGVGMCQWSAKELAERGMDWAAVLTRFYPGAKIEKAY